MPFNVYNLCIYLYNCTTVRCSINIFNKKTIPERSTADKATTYSEATASSTKATASDHWKTLWYTCEWDDVKAI